jgi:ectoine hydroxylase-related dioxygenase (phytanoyl-CoA dioxygenase family)
VLLDDFYFTCLIPITVPLTLDNGATEFMVGSHRRGASKFDHLELARAEVPIGSALLFNGKANHRGGANNSSHERPVLYKVYHKRWYNDQFRKGVALQDQ